MKELNNAELISFCSQLAMILRAGISAIEGISIMKDDLAEGEGWGILEKLYQEIETTGLLYESMRKTGVFPEYVCNMTEIGEQSGRLDEVMDGLAVHYENEEALSSSVKSALTYPMIMLGMMTAVVLVLVVKVMPAFDQVFQQLGGGLTGISAAVMNFGTALSRYSIILAAVIAAAAAAGLYLAFSKNGRKKLGGFLQKSRFTKDISEKMACARVADAMDLCIRSGLDIDQSLEMTERLVEHGQVRERIKKCREQMQEGGSFEDALTKSGLFSGVYGKMIVIGVRTGSVDRVMGKIARQYEEEVANRVQGIVAAIEPTLVAILSCMVGLILLSVMLPLMGIMANMG